ncbi:MAG: hypothetical protein EZS28_019005 [Streblomastix strix]|uniref:Uncharacterized protein n=1 Tax=Streblomastix strix TaxID=222440 RepID=A0A5J4VS74_9EUKA|nr:MAG: hypothetical protein EZS28_019005 [Streblomastix strix]
MSVLSSREMPDMSIQQLMVGGVFWSGVNIGVYLDAVKKAVNRLPLLSEDPKRQVEIKVYTGEQGHSNEDEAMRLRMQILNRFSPEEQQRVKEALDHK